MASIVDLVFKQSLVNDSSANTAYKLKHVPAVKKSDINHCKKAFVILTITFVVRIATVD